MMKKMIFPIITEFDMELPYYFAGVGCDYQQETISRPNGYPDYQWIQCRYGRGELILNGVKYIIESGQGVLLFPNEPHEYHASESFWAVDWIIFKGTGTHEFITNHLNINSSAIYYVSNPDIINDKIMQIYHASSASNSTKSLLCSSLVYSILLDIMYLTSVTQNTSIVNRIDRITPVLNYINVNYKKSISLQELADVADLTLQYLCSVFKKTTSQTPFEYINMVRIRKSKEMLLYNRHLQIKEISYNVGFEDVSYFCATFKKFESISPTKFRSLHN